MPTVRRFLSRLLALLRPDRAERELARELAAHLAVIEDDYRRRGLPAEAARRAAERALGSLDRAREGHRDQRSFPWLEDLRRDVPYAVRDLRRDPGFTIAAVVTLALGVGAASAVFSIINAILLAPLPYRDSDQLVQIAENIMQEGPDGPRYSRRFGMSQGEFLEWRARASTFSRMAGVINLMNGNLATDEGTVAAPRAIVSPALFEMLGVTAQLGRTLVAEDEAPGASAAVLSAAAWQQFFGSDPEVLGRQVRLNNTPFTVVGVMPPGFDYPEAATMFWTPLAPRPGPGTNAYGNIVALLTDGTSWSAANAEANTIGSALRATPPPGFSAGLPIAAPTATLGGQLQRAVDLAGRPRFEVLRVKDLIVDPIRPAMRVLAAAVVVVLLIVCANIANLLLARAASRHREIGVRLALGASRGRILRQTITESAVLSLAGGVAGTLVAIAGVEMVKTLATIDTPRLFQLSINLGSGSLLPRVGEVGVDATLLLLSIGVASAAGLLFGVAPAFYMSGVNAVHAIRAAGAVRTPASRTSRHHVRGALLLAQVGLATTLLVGAGLLIHSFTRLVTVDPGFDPHNVLTFQLAFSPDTAGDRQLTVIEDVIARLAADGRVASAGYTNIAPFLSVTESAGVFVPPGASREHVADDPLRPQARIVTHTYLQTIGAQLLEGRWLTEDDGGTQPPVLMVNRALAERYFGGRSPVGVPARLYRSTEYVETWQIVGVVENLKQARLDQEPFPIIFIDARQFLASRARMPKQLQIGMPLPGFPTIAVRARSSWQALAGDVRTLVRQIDPAVSVTAMADLESLRHGSLIRPRFYAVLLGSFAAIAAVLAAVGLYAVLAYSVVQRTHEIGVRMALGANRRAVLAGVLREGLTTTTVGLAVGLAGAAALTRSLSTMLFGLTALDAATYLGVAVAFMAVAALASYLPARRATRVDPVIALRCE